MRTCRHLPWKHYLKLLTQFMQRLSSASALQEHLLRTVVNVLDVFHFDLKMSATINQYGEGSERTAVKINRIAGAPYASALFAHS